MIRMSQAVFATRPALVRRLARRIVYDPDFMTDEVVAGYVQPARLPGSAAAIRSVLAAAAKDAALGVLNAIGTAGAAGHVVEYTGSVVRGFSMEQRMTLCNLTIEGGGRAGM